jgi:hypothetical protein
LSERAGRSLSELGKRCRAAACRPSRAENLNSAGRRDRDIDDDKPALTGLKGARWIDGLDLPRHLQRWDPREFRRSRPAPSTETGRCIRAPVLLDPEEIGDLHERALGFVVSLLRERRARPIEEIWNL